MFRKLGFAMVAATVAFAAPVPVAAQDWDPYTQCLIDHCFGNFQNDPVGYEACRRACARQFPPQAVPPQLQGKLD